MNRRKLKRAKAGKQKKTNRKDAVITHKAKTAAEAGAGGRASIDCIGNFIFFSTETGEAWMLDHRKSYALKLTENRKVLPYRINETKDRFQVEWKERFRIDGDCFIASREGEEKVYTGYPVDAIEGFIRLMQKDGREQ